MRMGALSIKDGSVIHCVQNHHISRTVLLPIVKERRFSDVPSYRTGKTAS